MKKQQAGGGGISGIVTVQPKRNGQDQPQTIGVYLGPNLKTVQRIQSKDPAVAFQLAWQYLSDICTQTFNGVVGVLKTFATGGSPPPGQSISGPIGLIKQVRFHNRVPKKQKTKAKQKESCQTTVFIKLTLSLSLSRSPSCFLNRDLLSLLRKIGRQYSYLLRHCPSI
jgi:hypothetical protein